MLAWAIVFAAAFSGEPPPAGEVPCDLVKVRTEERRLGLTPAGAEADAGGATVPETGVLHFLTLRCKGKQYVARVVGDLPGSEPTESKPSPLTVRFEGEKIIIKWPGGKEIEARYAAIETPPSAKPKAASEEIAEGSSPRGALGRDDYGAIDFTLFITMLSTKTPQVWPGRRSAQVPTLSWVYSNRSWAVVPCMPGSRILTCLTPTESPDQADMSSK